MLLSLLIIRIHLFLTAGARVDHGHHAGKAVLAINEAVALAKSVDKAVDMVNKGEVITVIQTFDFLESFL